MFVCVQYSALFADDRDRMSDWFPIRMAPGLAIKWVWEAFPYRHIEEGLDKIRLPYEQEQAQEKKKKKK
jgi:hypothetical protein